MASIFYLPKVTGLAGGKLYFYRTNTSNPQAVYQDATLETEHEQPVTANGSGVFAPIYLDPTLPDYRVTYTTPADVLVYTWDDYPSNQNTQQSMRLEATNPFLLLYDTDGTPNARKYRMRGNGNQLVFEMLNDAENSATEIFSCTAGIMSLPASVTVASSGFVAPWVSDTFTGTYTGFTTSPTESITYESVGGIVMLKLTGTSATSNATSMTITGIPVGIRPAFTRNGVLCRVVDNGTASIGTASIGADGVITFGLGVSGGVFTNSGTKATLAGMLVYERP